MIGRVIEVATDGAHLSVDRGFMVIHADREKLGQVALDDISVVVAHGHGVTISGNLLTRLADHHATVVICGTNHAPVSIVLPLDGHHEQGHRMQAQADASKPLRKRLWRDVVRAKIRAQGEALSGAGEYGGALLDLARKVRSGDPDNIEAQAARRYWVKLMGPGFRRNRHTPGLNSFLNYGYMVLRAATARSVVAAGLHPSLSIHHRSKGSALRLADDLMEPFRPHVDVLARKLARSGAEEMDRDSKAELAAIVTLDLQGPRGAAPLQTCLDRLALSLAQVYLGERDKLDLPSPDLALANAARQR